MPIVSDYAWVNFDVKFTDSNPSASRTFNINDGIEPEFTGYMLIQAKDVEFGAHSIVVNDIPLPGFDIPTQAGNDHWTTYMDRVPPNVLRAGANRITINRNTSNDDFNVANIVVHWRQRV